MGGMTDDGVWLFVRYAPMAFVIAGGLVVWWMSRQRLPHEIQADVLEALSETEALPSRAIRERPPLDHQDIDPRMLESILDGLCSDGLAVRWYEGFDDERRAVYRRIKNVSERAG